MKRIVALLVAVTAMFVAGCTSPGAFKEMSPDQIKAAVQDKAVFGNCTIVVGPGWTAKSSTISVDKGVVADGGVAVDPNTCGMEYTTRRAPPRTGVGTAAPNTTTTTVVAPTTTTISTPGRTITEHPQ